MARGKPWKVYFVVTDLWASVSEATAAMLLDIGRHSVWGWSPKDGLRRPPVLGDYPQNVAITARGALSALYIATGCAV